MRVGPNDLDLSTRFKWTRKQNVMVGWDVFDMGFLFKVGLMCFIAVEVMDAI